MSETETTTPKPKKEKKTPAALPDNRHIIQKAIFTEKSFEAQEGVKKPSIYFFQVEKKATKPEIKRAVTLAFDLEAGDIMSVRTLIRPGKFRRRGRQRGGYTPDRKKAIVTLRPGKIIDALQRG
jgi:large subunit ribosomal protein L23